MDEIDLTNKLINRLKKEYEGISEIIIEDKTLIIHADDDTLWKILADKRDALNMEFEAGSEDTNFLRILP
ncbi:MAG: hypothetical protein LUQ24_01875 [Methanobacterium sp.]|nr:hypothetical protein [Methanobacterium sp.]